MKVIKAQAMGLCFGVRDALDLAFSQREAKDITIHGELVHNEEVLGRLQEKGFAMAPELQAPELNRQDMPPTPKVLITAHGISHKERHRLQQQGKQLIDTTCPLVRKVHDAASRLQAEGYHVVVIGKAGHVEVRGIVGDLQSYHILSSCKDACYLPYSKLGVVCQTTFMVGEAQAILRTLRARNPRAKIHFEDTICEPTKQRIQALQYLVQRVDAMVVVGGKNSNNTRQLVRFCEAHGLPTYHIQKAADLDPDCFTDFHVVGLTAGTSTLDSTIDEVCQGLQELSKVHSPTNSNGSVQ